MIYNSVIPLCEWARHAYQRYELSQPCTPLPVRLPLDNTAWLSLLSSRWCSETCWPDVWHCHVDLLRNVSYDSTNRREGNCSVGEEVDITHTIHADHNSFSSRTHNMSGVSMHHRGSSVSSLQPFSRYNIPKLALNESSMHEHFVITTVRHHRPLRLAWQRSPLVCVRTVSRNLQNCSHHHGDGSCVEVLGWLLPLQPPCVSLNGKHGSHTKRILQSFFTTNEQTHPPCRRAFTPHEYVFPAGAHPQYSTTNLGFRPARRRPMFQKFQKFPPVPRSKAPQTFATLNCLPTYCSQTSPAASHQLLLQHRRSSIEKLVSLRSRRPAPRNNFRRELRTTNVLILPCDTGMRYSKRRITPPPPSHQLGSPPSFTSWYLCHLQRIPS